jgi:hypothetical protein
VITIMDKKLVACTETGERAAGWDALG